MKCGPLSLKTTQMTPCMFDYSWIPYELQVGTSLGQRHSLIRFQIWDHFWISQPKLHRATYLSFFVKPKNGLVWSLFAFLFFVSVSYLANFEIGDLSSNRYFSESDAQYERKSSTLSTFFEENWAGAKLSLVGASTIYRAHENQLYFLKN